MPGPPLECVPDRCADAFDHRARGEVKDQVTALHVRGDGMPVSGDGWDGRFDSLHDQAAFPLLDSNEMANAGPGAVVAKLRAGPMRRSSAACSAPGSSTIRWRHSRRRVWHCRGFSSRTRTFNPAPAASTNTSTAKVEISSQEQHGLALFGDPECDNCAACHVERGADGSHPLFTDYDTEALGVPRNPELRANADPRHFDMACAAHRGTVRPRSVNTAACSRRRRCARTWIATPSR